MRFCRDSFPFIWKTMVKTNVQLSDDFLSIPSHGTRKDFEFQRKGKSCPIYNP